MQNERDPIEEMKNAFKLICEEGHDKITLKSLQKVARELGENMTLEELKEMIDEADRDGDGEIGEDDFIKIMKKTNLFYWSLIDNKSKKDLLTYKRFDNCLR